MSGIATSLKPGQSVILPDGRRLSRLSDGSYRLDGDRDPQAAKRT